MLFIYRTLRMALHALRRNVMRSGLTTLGIVIGVAAVIAMTAIGQGTTAAVQRTIKSMGANNLLVLPGNSTTGAVSGGSGTILTLTPQDADAIWQDCPAVLAVAPIVRVRTQVVVGNRNWAPMYIYGTTPAFLTVRDWEALAEGEAFTDRDVRGASRVCLVGQTIVRELFPDESPLGKEVRVNGVGLKVVGVLRKKGANMMGFDQDDIVLAPWTTIKGRVAGTSIQQVNQSAAPTDPALKPPAYNQLYPRLTLTDLYPLPSPTQLADLPQPIRFANVDQILIKAASEEEIPVAVRQVREILQERHRIRPGQPDDFTIRDMTEVANSLGSTSTMMVRTLFFVALVSLLVGGIGIMNIMMVSVTERTREIGLRMAVGARARDILLQFLVEAIVLCLLGGLAGVGLGLAVAWLVNAGLNWPVEVTLPPIVAAVLVSGSVGVTFGFYPAWKASRLDPIDALRYE